jgi:VanZ family protein
MTPCINDNFRVTIKRTVDFLQTRIGMAILPGTVMLIILCGSLVPQFSADSPSFSETVIKNSVHIPMYLFLTLFLFLYFRRRKLFARYQRHSLYAAALVAFAFGLLIEIVQRFVPGRTADFFDIALNAWGIIIFVCLVRYYWYRERVFQIITYNPAEKQLQALAQNMDVLMLREKLLHKSKPDESFVVYVVSPHALEGKSTVCSALRRALAPVRGSILIQLHTGTVLDQNDRPIAMLQDEQEQKAFLLQQRHDKMMVFLDGEAILPGQHRFPAAPIAQKVDYILWVVAEGRTSNRDLARAKEFLAAPEHIRQGLIFNALLA